jgi:hypothetical protein
MAQLIKTSAYVRRDAQSKSRSAAPPSTRSNADAEAAIWSKLVTAHTVESLARTLDSELEGDMPTRERAIETAFERWLDEEAIELATDS